MFFASAPPLRITFLAAARERSPLVWKIQTSVALPVMVTSVGMVTVRVHLYRPGVRVLPPMLPVPRSRKSGVTRPAASVYAASMLLTAVVRLAGVGTAWLAA